MGDVTIPQKMMFPIVSVIICFQPTILNIFKIVGIVVYRVRFYSIGTVIANRVPQFIRIPLPGHISETSTILAFAHLILQFGVVVIVNIGYMGVV